MEEDLVKEINYLVGFDNAYKAFIEVGVSEDSATSAAEDVIQVSQLDQLATKTHIAEVRSEIALLRKDMTSEIGSLRSDMADREARLLKWMVSLGFLFAGIAIAGVGILFQIMLSPGVAQ